MLDDPWMPSRELRERLSLAIRATLLAGGLSAGGWAFELIQGDQPGLTPGRLLGLAAMLPTLWVADAFGAIGREVGRASLGRSARSLFGAVFLIEVYDLMTQPTLPMSVVVALRVVFWLGTACLAVLPFVSTGRTFALGVAAVLSVAGQTGLGIRPLSATLDDQAVDWELAACSVQIILACGFLFWFAITKIRSGRPLGGWATLMGWAEILGFCGSAIWVVAGYVIAIAVASNTGGPDGTDQLLEQVNLPMQQITSVLGEISELVMTGLTVGLFMSIRSRRLGE